MHYSFVKHDQGSPEWLAWRRGGFGGSDISALMGENRFRSREDIIAEKRGALREEMTDAMARGVELEPEARYAYNQRTGRGVAPACIQHNVHGWARVSLDGISECGNHVVEIKCGTSAFKKASRFGEIPDYYYGQLQHILFVTGLSAMDYWAFDPYAGGVLLSVERDDPYIERIVELCESLKHHLPT